jgi:hypothetical protein
MKIWGFVRLAIVAAVIILSAMNASWIAPQPPGVLKLIATQTGEDPICVREAAAQKAFVNGADFLMIHGAKRGCLDAKQAQIQMPKRKFMTADGDRFSAADWTWTAAAARACYDDYFKLGWLGIVPESCRGKTMLIPLDGQLKIWGWPKRFMARMNAADVRVILARPDEHVEAAVDVYGPRGLSTVTQLPEVPRDFTGYLLVDDISTIGPAIRR